MGRQCPGKVIIIAGNRMIGTKPHKKQKQSCKPEDEEEKEIKYGQNLGRSF
jgi:hypothetical protein